MKKRKVLVETNPNPEFLVKKQKLSHDHVTEENKKPFKCNECGTDFRVKKTLDRHIKTVHEGKDTPKFKIPCTTDPQISNKGQIQNQVSSVHDGKKSLKSNPVKKNELDNNIKKVHDGKNNDSLQKQTSDPLPFDCNSCWSRFASKPDLDQHNISAHQNKKQFKCNPCKVGFTSKQALNQHISSIHQGKKLTEQWKNQIASLLTSED